MGKPDKSQNGWTSQGRNYQQCSDGDPEGPSLTRSECPQSRPGKELREGEKLPKVTQQVLNFCKQLLSALLSPHHTGLEKRKPTAALLMGIQQKVDTEAT